MEELLQNLMDQPSNAQPKLLLRRTESIVEKLLTNWMSICLYGFLRVSPYFQVLVCPSAPLLSFLIAGCFFALLWSVWSTSNTAKFDNAGCCVIFSQETVGQPLFLMVSALNQQISKGPVDAVAGKALYTLSEDWLLWQAQGFNFSLLVCSLLSSCYLFCICHFICYGYFLCVLGLLWLWFFCQLFFLQKRWVFTPLQVF